MATAFEGEAIVGVVNVDVGDPGGGGFTTVYTVPAGRYARVNLREIDTNTGTVKVGGSLIGTGVSIGILDDGTDLKVTTNVQLSSGLLIETSAGITRVRATIFEYANP